MTKDELRAWIMLVVATGGYAIYALLVVSRAQGRPLTEVSYAAPMLWTIGGSIVVAVVLEVLVVIVTREPDVPPDERDRQINRFGEYTGQSLVVIGGVAALLLTLLEVDYFWIANTLFLGFILAGVLSSLAKIAAYRRGLPAW